MTTADRTISTILRVRILAGAGVCVMALAVWAVAFLQYRAASRAIAEDRASQRMMIAMLNQQTGLRGFALTRREAFLAPYLRGTTDFEDAVASVRRLADAPTGRQLDAQVTTARQWRALAEEDIARWRAEPDTPVSADREATRKRVFDRFRELNAAFQRDVAAEIEEQLQSAGVIGSATVVGLSLLFALIGYIAIEREVTRVRRRRAREADHRRAQSEFAETMQVMRNELEAYDLVKRYLERIIAGCRATVLNRNNSDNRLNAVTPVSDSPELQEHLRDATPESCVSVRLSRTFVRREGDSPLLSCELCEAAPHVACIPSLVSGDVIGTVLVQRDDGLQAEDIERATATVAQSAPVLANLRNLAIAETRAATDALTGLPNTRACRDTLKRMVAHAGRAAAPLSAILLDLDHFKQINDRFGHGAGDDVLAAVGTVLRATLRTSDFAGRNGGEEFLILLPDTDHHSAMVVAEKIRHAIRQIHIERVDRPITASLGVASYPRDARVGDGLVRQADRALYAAKAAGRDRVELAMSSDGGQPIAADAAQEHAAHDVAAEHAAGPLA
ncbi:MAG TPA: diguanylate cyclase [Euzebyales bacterium]|nr:diguanylate cyclase [Euzebyales bacterium]